MPWEVSNGDELFDEFGSYNHDEKRTKSLSRYSSPQVSAGYIQSTRSSSEKQKKTLKSIVKSKVIGKKISPSPKQLTTDVQKKL